MTHTSNFSWRRWLGGALLLAAPLLGWAQADPPARVAAISALEGGSAQLATDGRIFAPASINWPVTSGTRIVTEPGARLELHSGWTAMRATNAADIDVTLLDDSTTQLALMNGTLSLRVRQLQPGERVEIDTPQLALVATQPGEYRVDVDPRADATRVTVHMGSAAVYGEAGQASQMGAGQQVQFSGRALAVTQSGAGYRDGFDQWAASRDALEDRSLSARYVPRDLPGYQQLDAYGQWSQDPTYGAVWYPTVTSADWAPYRYGRWTWVEPWGWTWVDDAPWGFAPSHYGRWAQIGPRWAWVPGSFGTRPVYAPALVAFIGGAGGSLSLGAGLPGAAWFPLAPGEYWTPHYRASDRYRRGLNWGDGRAPARPPADGFHFQHRPGAITAAPVGQFGSGDRGRGPRFIDGSRLETGALGNSRVVAPPPRFGSPAARAQNPLPMPRPDRHGMTDPRESRIGADRGVAPMPGVVPPRFGQDGQRPAPGMVSPGAPMPPAVRPAPDFGQRDGERFPRDRMEREGARPYPAPAPRSHVPDQQLRELQMQQQQSVIRDQQQQQRMQQQQQRVPMAPPAAAPTLPRPSFEHAPRQMERPAMPQAPAMERRGEGRAPAPMREPQLNPATGLTGR